jgi:hypothetical protein
MGVCRYYEYMCSNRDNNCEDDNDDNETANDIHPSIHPPHSPAVQMAYFHRIHMTDLIDVNRM